MFRSLLILAAAGLVLSCSQPLVTGLNTVDTGSSRALDVPVILVRGQSLEVSQDNTQTVGREFIVKVKVLSSAPVTVNIHHQTASGTWIDLPGTFAADAEPGFQLWKVLYVWNSSEGDYPMGDRFCVKYTSGNTVYWDNNGNKDFYLSRNGGYLLGTSVNVLNRYPYYVKSADGKGPIEISGFVDVKNIAYAKVIKIHYTLDAWKTVSIVNAVYNDTYWHDNSTPVPSPNSNAVEFWTYKIPLLESDLPSLEYVISYTVAGKTYWDNNCNYNFRAGDLASW